MEIKRGDVPSHTVARFTRWTSDVQWFLRFESFILQASWPVTVWGLASMNCGPHHWMAWAHLHDQGKTHEFSHGYNSDSKCAKHQDSERFSKIEIRWDTLICLATVSIHFRHYPKNYKNPPPVSSTSSRLLLLKRFFYWCLSGFFQRGNRSVLNCSPQRPMCAGRRAGWSHHGRSSAAWQPFLCPMEGFSWVLDGFHIIGSLMGSIL